LEGETGRLTCFSLLGPRSKCFGKDCSTIRGDLLRALAHTFYFFGMSSPSAQVHSCQPAGYVGLKEVCDLPSTVFRNPRKLFCGPLPYLVHQGLSTSFPFSCTLLLHIHVVFTCEGDTLIEKFQRGHKDIKHRMKVSYCNLTLPHHTPSKSQEVRDPKLTF
jgi:hypothetical protein